MDTLGIDASDAPVIIEFKKGGNASVISQAAYYFTWLTDHKADFEKLVHKVFPDRPVNWEKSRLICMAETFNFYDYSAIKLINVRMELLKYRFYGDDLLYITPDRPVDIEERLTGKAIITPTNAAVSPVSASAITFDELLQTITSEENRSLLAKMREQVVSISSDIQAKINRSGITFHTSVSFCEIIPRKSEKKGIMVWIPNRLLTPEMTAKFGLKQGKESSTYLLDRPEQLPEFTEIVEAAYEASV